MAAQKNIWDQILLFNQNVLKNIIGGSQDLRTPEVIEAIATMSNQLKFDAIFILDSEAGALAELPNDRGLQTIDDVKAFIEMIQGVTL